MELKVVRWEMDDAGVAVVTLDRPDRLNAWTGRMERELRWVLADLDDDPGCRAVVLTGAGRGFCAGADTRALAQEAEAGHYDPGLGDAPVARPGAGLAPDFDHTPLFVMGMATPVIAAVNGAAAGVGLVLASACDLRFVAADAKLTAAHGPLGLPAEMGLSWLLPRLIGLTHASDLLLSSRIFLGREATELGWANRCLDDAGEVLPAAVAYARDLAARVSPSAAAATKQQLHLDLLRSLDEAARDARARLDDHMGGPEFREGVSALRDGRAPRWDARAD